MMKNKLAKNIKYIIVTILAIFCVCSNVNAARTIDSLGDSNDVITAVPNSGQVINSGNTKVSGVTCPYFNVSVLKNASITAGHKTTKGYWAGPYIDNQGNMMYNVQGASAGCAAGANAYTAFCLDPNFDGVKTGQTLKYKAEPVDINSNFGKRIYALYTMYREGLFGAGTDKGYFTYEVAARILALKPDSTYQSRSNTAKARHNSWLKQYREGNVPGDNDGAAAAQMAMQRAESSNLQEVIGSTLGVSLSQVGGIEYNGNTFKVNINVTVENCQSDDCVSDDGSAIVLTGNMTGTPTLLNVTPPSKTGNNTKVFTYSVTGNVVDGCINLTLNVALTYNSAGDVRGAMQISPVSATFDDRQNYIVFQNTGNTPGGGGGDGGTTPVTVNNTLIIDNCGKQDDDDDSCPWTPEIACDAKDENFVVINEGSENGNGVTNWDDCIINKTDPKGNSYDVVNTSKLRRDQAADQSQIDDYALYDRTDAILGYTTDNSGGGSVSNDPHSIDDADFCIISCKEQYAFILPGNKKEVKQGTYFSFQVNHDWEKHAVVGVSAERTCVSSNMKTSNFNGRVKDLRKQQLDYLNMYAYYKQLYNAMLSTQAMNKYKENKVKVSESDCEYDDDGANYEEERDPTCSSIINNKFSEAGYLPEWDGSNVTLNVKYYKLSNENDMTSSIVVAGTKSVNLGESYVEAFGSNSRISFYRNYYPDYAIFDTDIDVESITSDTYYQGPDSAYHLKGYNGRHEKTETVDNGDGWTTIYSGYEYTDEVYEYHEAKIRNMIPGSQEFGFWDSLNIDSDLFQSYKIEAEKLKTAYTLAKAKYEALNAQIGIQADAMQECTNYLDNFSQDSDVNSVPYRFDPVLTFSYPSQPTYMKMLAPNQLENMNEGTPEVNYTKYFCANDPGNAENVFNCGDQASSKKEFGFGDIFDDPSDQQLSNPSDAQNLIPNIENDVIEYYDVARVGSRATYGRYTDTGQDGCSKGHVSDPSSAGRGSYCYEFYQSAKQFYTQAPDGIVTTNPSGENKTILSTDGRVYPVSITTPAGEYPFYLKIANIGQFNESSSLGRIMGGGDGKGGILSGEYGDTEVCYYEVCRVDDPDCDHEDDGDCATIVKDKCNNGAVDYTQYFNDHDYEECLKALMADESGCCSYVDDFKARRKDGNFAGAIPTSIWNDYSVKCDKTNECTSFTIISTETWGNDSDITDVVTVENNGALQVNARAVSLNNLFPNDQKGTNWYSSEALATITAIETEGEGIFGVDCRNSSDPNCHGLDYSAVIDAKCADEIRKYNSTQEGVGSGYGNGGFNDYTNTVTNAEKESIARSDLKGTTDPTNEAGAKKGTIVEMSSDFENLIKTYCQYEGKPAPDVIIDTSSLVLEPWQYTN